MIGVALRKLFNHLHEECRRATSHVSSSIDYQRIAVQDVRRRYALVVCESSSFSPLPTKAVTDLSPGAK